MAIYRYECINKNGETVIGRIDATGETQAAQKLQEMKYLVVSVKRVREFFGNSLITNQKRVKPAEKIMFTRQLASMLSAGIPITRTLYTLSEQNMNRGLEDPLLGIAEEVEAGMSFSEALRLHPAIFSDMYVRMVEAGEVGGSMVDSLERLSEQLEKDKALQDAIKAAMFYPKLVLGLSLVIVFVMITFIVPMFRGFIPATAQIPFVTQLIFDFSDWWLVWWYTVPIAIILLIVLIKSIKTTPAYRKVKEKVLNAIPGFGSLIKKSVTARFSRTLSGLLSSGIPVVQALERAGPTSGSFYIERAIEQTAQRVEQGGTISNEIEETKLFDPMLVHMIRVGEESGRLPELLEKVAQFYEDEVSVMTKGLASIIEPLMLIGVGLLTGGMLIALYLPIFTVVTTAG